MKAIIFALFALAISAPVYADYFAIGKIEGQVCYGFGIEVCGLHIISAVKGDDGKLYEPNTHYQSVSEYRESSGRCWIHTKTTKLGLFNSVANAVFQPTFYEKVNGEYEKLDVEYITFKCRKR
jgi:hypothetical protein